MTDPMELPWRRLGDKAQLWEPMIVLKPEKISIGRSVRIDGFVKLEGGRGVTISDWVHIASFAHINIGGGRVTLGEGCAVTSGAKILGGSNHKSGLAMSVAAPAAWQCIKRSFVVLEPLSFVGSNAVVLPGVVIGEGAVLGAGAVATKNIPAWEIWAGVPAVKIGEREKGDLYERWKRGEPLT